MLSVKINILHPLPHFKVRTMVSISTFAGPGLGFGVSFRDTREPIEYHLRPLAQLDWIWGGARLEKVSIEDISSISYGLKTFW